MLKLYADYHTHTRYSHGKGDIEDNVVAALGLGLKTIAITDHSYGHMGFGVRKSDLPIMKERICLLRERYPQIEILLGLEANVLDVDGSLDIDDSDLDYLDILLAGYHFGSMPKGMNGIRFHTANFLSRFQGFSKESEEMNTAALCNAMARYPITILSHPGAKGPIAIEKVAATASERGVWLEINAHHGHLSVDQIRAASVYDVGFVISSDAHRPEDVGNCNAGIKRALEAGLSEDRIVNCRQE